jgi:hypothetical protein
VTLSLAEYTQIELGQRIVGHDFDQGARGKVRDQLSRSPHRLRTMQPQTVEFVNVFASFFHT